MERRCGVCGKLSLDGTGLRLMRAPEHKYGSRRLEIDICGFCLSGMERDGWTPVASIPAHAMDFDSGMEREYQQLLGQQLVARSEFGGVSPDATWTNSAYALPACKDRP